MYRKILATLFCVSFLCYGSARGDDPGRPGRLFSGAGRNSPAVLPPTTGQTGTSTSMPQTHGLGQTVSGWTHQGIHGTELAGRIHQLQGKTWNTSTLPSNPNGQTGTSFGGGRGGRFGFGDRKFSGKGRR